jgi:Skp1 family, dimerisation domain/Skp1 family, tetramerisation domain
MSDTVTLQTNDNVEFIIPVQVAKMSRTIADLMEDAIDRAIPLSGVSSSVLARVIEYCTFHVNDPIVPVPVEQSNKDEEKRTDDISEWDLTFCNAMDRDTLFTVILAANYLDVSNLLIVLCKTVANMIKGKTPDELRTTFNITEDFTPEEEAAYMEGMKNEDE